MFLTRHMTEEDLAAMWAEADANPEVAHMMRCVTEFAVREGGTTEQILRTIFGAWFGDPVLRTCEEAAAELEITLGEVIHALNGAYDCVEQQRATPDG